MMFFRTEYVVINRPRLIWRICQIILISTEHFMLIEYQYFFIFSHIFSFVIFILYKYISLNRIAAVKR